MDEIAICEIERIKSELINSINWSSEEEEEQEKDYYFCYCIPCIFL